MRTPLSVQQRGVMLIEALLAILIFSIGILAVVGMQSVAIKDVAQAKYRSEAGFLADELVAQLWTDNGNIAAYNWPQGGSLPTRLQTWAGRVNSKMPGGLQPVVTVTGATAQGGTVQIQIFWQMPEEVSQGTQHSYTVLASVYTS
jgi:type IV pilus assembly protein PilV